MSSGFHLEFERAQRKITLNSLTGYMNEFTLISQVAPRVENSVCFMAYFYSFSEVSTFVLSPKACGFYLFTRPFMNQVCFF